MTLEIIRNFAYAKDYMRKIFDYSNFTSKSKIRKQECVAQKMKFVDLNISLYVHFHIKIKPWKFHIPNRKNSQVISP